MGKSVISSGTLLIGPVLDSLSSHVAVLDANGFIIAVNKVWKDFAEKDCWSLGPGIGINYLDICRKAASDIDEAHKALLGIVDVLNGNNKFFSMEFACHSLAEKKWFLMNVTNLESGGAVISYTNITSTKFAEQKLSDKERFYRFLIQNSTDVIVLMDKNWKVKYVSPSVETVTGFTPEERMNSVTIDFLHPDDIPMVREQSATIGDGESSKPIVIRARHKTKGWIWTEVIASNFINDPAIEAYIINYRDIDERKKAEEILMKYKKELQEVNESKDKLFSIISHDLRSPFHSLLGLSELISEEAQDMTTDEIKSIGSHIHEAAKGLYTLAEDLLQWSRFKTGKIVYTPAKLDLKEIIDQAVSVYALNASDKRIKIEVNCDLYLSVFADAYMIESVFRNLISNSIKFTHTGGSIRIKAIRKIGDAVVSVIDNGVGIEEERLQKLFSIGEKISTYGTQNEKGTGLGLVLCKEFVETNKGQISVLSKPGRGTNVTFTIPAAD